MAGTYVRSIPLGLLLAANVALGVAVYDLREDVDAHAEAVAILDDIDSAVADLEAAVDSLSTTVDFHQTRLDVAVDVDDELYAEQDEFTTRLENVENCINSFFNRFVSCDAEFSLLP